MRTTTAFFAGVGTVVIAIAVGLGGGMVIANIASPHQPKAGAELTKLERRAAEPVTASNAPAEPVPYLAATRAAATNPVVVDPAPQAPPQQAEPAQQTNTSPTNAASSEPERGPNAAAQPAANAQPSAQTAARTSSASSGDALARARDAESKRDARRVEQRRKAERRQQWAERRRVREPRDDELRDVERSVREDTERSRVLEAEPVSVGMPRIRLFGDDD
ncbi:hypothetical protein [Bradyrhizobium neotropicale]|uniref:hypothetical protein n=1 Tax=Bradyrhizobium neotropicale TaxID=1497615 RepID=UPI001AD7176B|nr:hypothetical protein [Bradyrhizobium neotropicale]MBO4223518.1 hypothetical protein [Bradyrhizobium neotropicale]